METESTDGSAQLKGSDPLLLPVVPESDVPGPNRDPTDQIQVRILLHFGSKAQEGGDSRKPSCAGFFCMCGRLGPLTQACQKDAWA